MGRFTRALAVVCVLALVLPAVPGVLAAGAYGLDSPSAVAVPGQTVHGAGEFITVTEIARVQGGEPFEVRTAAPDGATYGVELRGLYGTVVDVSDGTLRGNDSTTFETGSLRPGSYVAVLYDGGAVEAVLPVVIAGYGVSTTAPETAEAGSDVTVSANLTAVPGAPSTERVEVVVADRSTGEVVVQKDMTADGREYVTTVRLAEPGEYELYVNVRGERTVEGYHEVLGFGDTRTLSVAVSDSPTTAEATEATRTGTVTPTASTTVPEGVITRNATADPSSPVERSPTAVLSVVFGLLLVGGLGLILRGRR